jgi:Uma2 family endonuclease
MSTLHKIERLPVEDYLVSEQHSEVRHEYVAGTIVAMVGGTERHNAITLSLAATLREHLRGRGCRVFASDMKVRVGDVFYYPDVMVVCGTPEPTALFQTSPVILAEVMSDSTEAKDRLEKLVAYQSLPSLNEYVLLAQDKVRADVYRRENDGWQLESLGIGDVLRLASVTFSAPIEKVYEDVLGSFR